MISAKYNYIFLHVQFGRVWGEYVESTAKQVAFNTNNNNNNKYIHIYYFLRSLYHFFSVLTDFKIPQTNKTFLII